MKKIFKKKQSILTEIGECQLIYELFSQDIPADEGGGQAFGIQIIQLKKSLKRDSFELYDSSTVAGISELFSEAEELYFLLVKGYAMPVSLCNIVDDWQSAFHPCYGKHQFA